MTLTIDPITLLNAHIVLASAYQIEEQWNEAGKIVEILIQKTKNKMKFRRYNTVNISAFISILSFLSYTEQYEELLKQSRYLREYQEKHSEYNRSYFADYFCSVATYNLNKLSESKECFIKGLRSALYLKNKIDIDHITKSKEFKEILENLDIDEKLIDELYELLESSEN